MNSDKTFWFEQPYMPGSYNIAVQQFLGTDGRLHFSVPMRKYWALAGNLIKDEGEYFEFCVMMKQWVPEAEHTNL